MIIKFVEQILIGDRCYSAGETIELDDAKSSVLFARGVAVEVQPDAVMREAVDPAPKTARRATARKTQ